MMKSYVDELQRAPIIAINVQNETGNKKDQHWMTVLNALQKQISGRKMSIVQVPGYIATIDAKEILIIKNKYMIDISHKLVDRNWWQRLFSLPWHPLMKKHIVRTEEVEQMVYFNGNKFYCHDSVAEKLMDEINKKYTIIKRES